LSASNLPPRAVILGCAGTELSDQEKQFFQDADPFGFILFGRNVESPQQLRALTASLRDCVGRAAPILIDQEGGRVRRLRPPHWREAPPMRPFGVWFEQAPDAAAAALRQNIHLMADELRSLGIDVDCAPVMDVPVSGAHDIIGDRAFSTTPKVVGALGKAVCDAFLERGVYPVIKHIPGHGRATEDSHKDLPVVKEGLDALVKTDFEPFLSVKDAPFAMTAHIVYSALDSKRPATLSPVVIDKIIRHHIGFDGLLMTDDLSMKALKGDFTDLAQQSIAAGCDLVLHCNGDMAEMQAVIEGCGPLSDRAMVRWLRAQMARNASPEPLPTEAEQSLAEQMAQSGFFASPDA
jgi:beta-N-acetylhexosaminidase